MVPFLRMLERQGLSLDDAARCGFGELGEAVRRCNRCAERLACIRWLERYRHGRAPECPNAFYLAQLKARTRSA